VANRQIPSRFNAQKLISVSIKQQALTTMETPMETPQNDRQMGQKITAIITQKSISNISVFISKIIQIELF
jgi:hypothetical protein